jgi:hypothetical protein
VEEYGIVGVAEYMKAVAKNTDIWDLVPNWSKECGCVRNADTQLK